MWYLYINRHKPLLLREKSPKNQGPLLARADTLPLSSKMRKFCDYFLILPYFLYSIFLILCTTRFGLFVSRIAYINSEGITLKNTSSGIASFPTINRLSGWNLSSKI